MIRSPAEIGSGLLPARAPRRIEPGERVHVLGAAGAGASAAALLAHLAGARVTGCDAGGPSPYTIPLLEAGIPLEWVHEPDHVREASGRALIDRLSVTKALTSVQPDHPELRAARELNVPVEPWQQLIADVGFTQGARLAAVSGTHGKSTSAGWLVNVLVAAGRDPSAFVGALLDPRITGTGADPATARWGRGDTLVVEADEYAGNFDAFRPDVAILLNAEWDHPDVFRDESAVLDVFEQWIRAPGPESRTLVANIGDSGIARLVGRLDDWTGRIVRVGLASDGAGEDQKGPSLDSAVDLVGRILATDGGRSTLRLGGSIAKHEPTVRIRLAGAHNAANALCVIGAAHALGLALDEITPGLEQFGGVGRRMEVKGEAAGITVLDDYGHHPTAISATLAAVRQRYPGRRVWAVYEPLTFHRTAAMLEQFAMALMDADEVAIAPIWAGRDPDTTITSAEALAEAVRRRGNDRAWSAATIEATTEGLLDRVREGDVVLVMGGGHSYQIADGLSHALRSRSDG